MLDAVIVALVAGTDTCSETVPAAPIAPDAPRGHALHAFATAHTTSGARGKWFQYKDADSHDEDSQLSEWQYIFVPCKAFEWGTHLMKRAGYG